MESEPTQVQKLCQSTQKKIKNVCKGLFLEGKLKIHETKIPTSQIFHKMLAKMRVEHMQGMFLTKRMEILTRDPDEVYEKTMEAFESLFRKRKLYAHAYVCCLMIVLKQRNSLGLAGIELTYIKRALKMYRRVKKREFREDLQNFTPIFRTVLEEAGKISLTHYIYVKMQLYMSYFHKHHGQGEIAVDQLIVYLNYRLESGMYARNEEMIAELLNCTIDCIEINMLNQASHLLNGIRALLDRLDSTEPKMRFQKVVLLEFSLLITGLLLARNIENVRGYQQAQSAEEKMKFVPIEKMTPLKMEIEDLVRIKLVPNTATEAEIDQVKAKLLQFKKLLTEPIIQDLAVIFLQIFEYLGQFENFTNLDHIELDY